MTAVNSATGLLHRSGQADGYRGLGAGGTATLAVHTVNVMPTPQVQETRRLYSVRLESIANPPEWVIA